MKITIRHRVTNEIIVEGDYEDLREAVEKNKTNLRGAYLGYAYLGDADLRDAYLGYADLRGADLRYANLGDADLGDADLRYANLGDAYLGYADLRDADLRYANLGDAYLGYAEGVSFLTPYTLNDYIKEYQIEKEGDYIFVYKGVSDNFQSPLQTNNPIEYKIGAIIEVDQANPDVFTVCGHGINLSPSLEASKEWGTKTVKVKVHIGDIVCIPIEHDKFRVKKCEVIEEVNRDSGMDA